MIFYFTGTGNSLYAASFLRMQDEELVDIAAATKQERYHYALRDGERVGFVFPTYCYTLADYILDFLRHVEIEGISYAFGVMTCGGGMGGAGACLKKALGEKGIELNYLAQVVMTDNTVFYWDLDDTDEIAVTQRKADETLAEIKSAVEGRKTIPIKGGIAEPFYRLMYHALMKTKAFHVTDECLHCEKCARECPSGAIEMKDGLPTWTKDKCVKCSACINRCPVRAIQYGKKTESRRRYTHSILRSK